MSTQDEVEDVILSAYHKHLKAEGNSMNQVILSYIGNIEQDLVLSVSSMVEDRLERAGERRGTIKFVVSTIIELLQNVLNHAEKDTDKHSMAYFLLINDGDSYVIKSGNHIRSELQPKLHNDLSKIEKSSKLDIQQSILSLFRKPKISDTGSAGLGLYWMAEKAKKVTHDFVKIDDEFSLFNIEIYL